MIFLYILIGALSGIIAGMGMGGGTLLIPFLTIFFGIIQKDAQGINLFCFIPMAVVVIIIHLKNKLIDIKQGLLFICFGVIFSAFGAILANFISNNILKLFFAMFLIVIGLIQIFKVYKNFKNNFLLKKKSIILKYYAVKYFNI